MPQRIWIKNPLAIFTANDLDATGGVVVANGQIEACLKKGEAPATAVDQIFDASELVVLPGLINTHHHCYQTLTRAYPDALNKALFPWLVSLYPVWAGLERDMITLSTRLAAVELLLSGCTTMADHHYLFPEAAPEALDAQVQGLEGLGLRAVLTRGSMSLGEDEGGLPPRNTVQSEAVILRDSERVIGTYHDGADGSFLNIALAPCSPFSVSEALMRDSALLARQHGVRLHTHLAETHDETAFCEKMFGLRPVDYLEKVGWMQDDVWLAHGIHFNDEEIQRLGQAGVGVAHCPSSNMVLASGMCPTLDLEAAGAPVGLAVDGSASCDSSNMIQEVRQAMLLGRLRYGADRVTHFDALRWATRGSAEVLGRSDIGQLAPGKRADLALFSLDELRFSGAGDALAALLLCGAHRAEHVMVDGQWRVRGGEMVDVDIQALMHSHRACARRLAQRAQG